MSFILRQTPIQGVVVLDRSRHEDFRGSLLRSFDRDELAALGLAASVAQVNVTRTNAAGTVRGMHIQLPPYAEQKIVRCLIGRVFDVAVDLRPSSSTFGRWFACELAEDSPFSVVIPAGVAHGLQCLEADSVMHYVHSAPYSAEAESGVCPLDAELAVEWPLKPKCISDRDMALPALSQFKETM